MAKRTRFLDLLERHEREIYRYAYRMTGSPEDASDVLQETCLRAFKAFPRLPGDANHRAWLYRIASRQSLNLLRSRRARPTESMEGAAGLSDPSGDPEALVEERRLAERLTGVLDGLPPRQRAALLLKKYEGLSYRDVAEALQTTEANARAHVYQAMKKVRSALS